MRKTLLFLAVLMTLVYCPAVHAAVDPYEVMAVTPAEGTVTSLQHFTITFGGLPVTVTQGAIPTLQKGGGATLEGHMSLDDDGQTLYIDFDQNCTAGGDYYLNIPENALTVNGQRLLPLTLRFNIAIDADSFHSQITVDPAEGTVERLQNFTISFPKYIGGIGYNGRATLRHEPSGRTYQAALNAASYNVMAYFPDEVTKPGDYTLTIPAGAVEFYTVDFDVQELTFHYTIEGEVELFYDLITINPAEGTVSSLEQFTISLPETVDAIAAGSQAMLTNATNGATYPAAMTAAGHDVTVDLGQEITTPGEYTLTIPEASLIVNALGEDVAELNFHYTIKSPDTAAYTINPPEGEVYMLQNFTIDYGTTVAVDENARPILVNDETGEAYDCHLIEIGGNAFVYKEYPLSVVGSYTLHVPAACIELLENGTVNPQMAFHYTIVEKDIYIPPVIEDQPEGELRLYQRTGVVIREVEKEVVGENEWPYEITTEAQDGSMSVVFGTDGKVYIQRPVSWSYYNGWVEGTLSADGKTITVPMGQYIAYAKSLEMAVQVAMFTYDEERNSYFYNPAIEQVTYTINADGTITLNGTDELNILGTMNRAFGQQFQYLDYEWLQAGDCSSVYIPIEEMPLTPPQGMATESYYLTTAINDGIEWEPYEATVAVGFDGEDMWLQGISKYLPSAWIKGHVEGNTVTFANTQLLGAYEVLLYFKAADYNPVNGNTTQKDMVLNIDGDGTKFYTYDYAFITTDKDNLSYINYYQGLTLSKQRDAVVEAPQGLKTYQYKVSYKTLDEYGSLVSRQDTIAVGFSGNQVYIGGLWEFMPGAWVTGRLDDGQLVLDLPQYMGDYDQENELTYPIYLNAFDQSTGRLNRQLSLTYDPATHSFQDQSSAFGFGINKTGYLNVKDYYGAVIEPLQDFLAGDVNGDGSITITDVVLLNNYILTGQTMGINLAAADVDRNGQCNISDTVQLINFLLNN